MGRKPLLESYPASFAFHQLCYLEYAGTVPGLWFSKIGTAIPMWFLKLEICAYTIIGSLKKKKKHSYFYQYFISLFIPCSAIVLFNSLSI